MKQALFLLSAVCSLVTNVSAETVNAVTPSSVADMAVANELGAQNTYNDVIFQPSPSLHYSLPNHIVLDPTVTNVTVEPRELDLKKEAASFAQFRVHYAVYWSLFMTMLILDAAWVE